MQPFWKAALTCAGAVFPTGVTAAEITGCLAGLGFAPLSLLHLGLAALFEVQISSAGVILQESFTVLLPWLSYYMPCGLGESRGL